MNWVGDWIQDNININDIVLDLGCGVMQATLDHIKTYPKTKLICKRLIGVDIYQPYLDFLNERGIETIKWDLRKTPYPFKDKSVDVTILTDIFEHFEEIKDADALINEAIRITRKKLFMVTPREFYNNVSGVENPPIPYDQFGSNEFQRHHILVDKKYLKEHGFEVNIKGLHYYGIRNIVNKILHVWDCAGVAGCLSKYQNKLGYESKVYLGIKEKDSYGFADFYNEVKEIVKPFRPLANNILSKIYRHLRYYYYLKKYVDEYEPNIIHFHSLEFIPLLFPLKKKVVEFHGTRLRRNWADGSINKNVKTPQWIFLFYKVLGIKCLYSTPDLDKDIPKWINKMYLPNPVDLDHFKISGIEKRKALKVLYIKNHYEDVVERLSYIPKEIDDLNLYVLDKEKGEFINYKEMPKFLEGFEYYIDRNNIESLSKTALECLAMGIKVVDWCNEVIEGLPYEHEPFNVARKTLEIYDKIMVDKNED